MFIMLEKENEHLVSPMDNKACFQRCQECQPSGILNHCEYPIHTGRLEGVNNKIKVIKRRAYGFDDLRYFSLKIIQAFTN